MTKFKIYLRTNGNIKEQAETYALVFSGEIKKLSLIDQTSNSNNKDAEYEYANISIVDGLTIMISKHNHQMPKFGYSSDTIISFDSIEKFEEIYSRLIQSEKFMCEYDKTTKSFGGGVVIAKFYDIWGNGWIIERKIK